MNDAGEPVDPDETRRREQAGWIADIAAGGRLRERAMEALFHAYERRVVGWLRYAFTIRLHEAQELWQEVLVSICKHAHTFRAGSDPRAWIYKIAKNEALDLVRRASRRNEVPSEDGSDPADKAAAPAVSDLDCCVRQAFARFAAEHPEMARWIAMAEIEERDIPEVAAQLDRSLTATRTYLKTLRQKIRPYLEPCLELRKA